MDLKLITQKFNNNESDIYIKGFILNYNNKKYIITLHQNLPINNVLLNNDNTTNDTLNILINSCWNELLILEYIKTNFYREYNSYNKTQYKLPNINDILYLNYNFVNYNLNITEITFISFNNIDENMLLPFIIANIINFNKNLIELIGLPVLLNNKLIGIITKINNKNNNIFILPVYIIIKTLLKKDNNNIYILNNYENIKKINSNIIHNNNIIYHNKLKYKIPLYTYFLLEGDFNKIINITLISDTITIIQNIFKKYMLKITNEMNIIINEEKSYKITSRLLSLIRYYSKDNILLSELFEIINNNVDNDSIWININ